MRATMSLGNVDRPPLGDVATSILTMVATNPEVEFVVSLSDDGERLELRGSELPRRLAELVAYPGGAVMKDILCEADRSWTERRRGA